VTWPTYAAAAHSVITGGLTRATGRVDHTPVWEEEAFILGLLLADDEEDA
jgi:hypothetical protein